MSPKKPPPAPAVRDVPVPPPTSTFRPAAGKQRLTVWLPMELAEALREVAHEEWRTRPPPRGKADATRIIERALRADEAVAAWLRRKKR